MASRTRTLSFLDLPAEIRLAVYRGCAIPHNAPFSAYQGLYLSCHRIHSEMEAECAKALKAYLDALKDEFGPDVCVRCKSPDTFASMRNVELSLCSSVSNKYDLFQQWSSYRVTDSEPTEHFDWDLIHQFNSLLVEHFDSLTLSYHDCGGRAARDNHLYFLLQITAWAFSRGVVCVRACKMTFRFPPADNTAVAKIILDQLEHLNNRSENWTFTWIIEADQRVKAEWRKKEAGTPITDPYEKVDYDTVFRALV